MTVKPLNLSILIGGDMNRQSPQISPRQVILTPNNKKSRIPLATSQTPSGHEPRSNIRGGVTTFRQWADPPPPPPRSRPLDRKTATPKKRPGSADPRFRRSLETKKCATPQPETIKLCSSFSELTASNIQGTQNNVREVSSYIPQLDRLDRRIDFFNPMMPMGNIDPRNAHLRDLSLSPGDISSRDNSPRKNSPRENSPRKNSPGNNSPLNNSPRDISPRDNSPRKNSPRDKSPEEISHFHKRKHLRSAKYEAVSDKIKNIEDIMSVYPLPYGKPKELEIQEIFGNSTRYDVTSESKYSQTEVYSTDYQQDTTTEIAEQSEIFDDPNKETDILQFIARNYEKTSKFLDGIVLNRTRSISTIYELEPVNRIRCKNKRSYGRVSKILLKQNYWTYIEIWAAISFLAAILMFGWFYLIPYIFDAFYSWIYPPPQATAMDYYRTSFGDIFYSTVDQFYNLLTTPANRRLS